MKHVDPRCPSLSVPTPYGLWSLWEMLGHWGYLYLVTGTALAYAEMTLEQQRARTGGAVAGHGTSILNPNHPADDQVMSLVQHKLDEVLGLMRECEKELHPLSTQIELLKTNLINSRKPYQLELYTNDVLDKIREIKNQFCVLLYDKKFYYISPLATKLYGKPLLFGERVAKKFPGACADIESAGNCLALGEPTACVLHLNRAMEIATRRLAKKLGATLDAKDTWGQALGKMTNPINALPDKTEGEKRKKERWAECRTNLFHIKTAWRDPSFHGKRSYNEREARDILQRVDDFMQQLATLL